MGKEHFPDIQSIYVTMIDANCEEGTKQMTILGQRQCRSICGLNQYFDSDSSSCKDRVPFEERVEHKERPGKWACLVIAFVAAVLFVCALWWSVRSIQECNKSNAEEESRKETRQKYEIESKASRQSPDAEESKGEVKKAK